MSRLTLISVLVILTVAVALGDRPTFPWLWIQDKIIGGDTTTIEEFPYQVSLSIGKTFECGGSIISSNKVLTAAHCTYGQSTRFLNVRVGSSNYNKGGTVIKVKRICEHPQYNSGNYDNDVAVLILANSINMTSAVQPIALAELGSSVPVGTLAVATGWGLTSEDSSYSKILRKVEVPKMSQEDCKKAYNGRYTITDGMTCYGYPNGGKDACQGDSGGPLAIGRTLVGVTSWGVGCAQPGNPGVYADVAKAIIRNHIDSC